MVWTPGRQRCLRRYWRKVVVAPLIGDGMLDGRLRRCKKPVESAFETKSVVDEAVV